MNAIGNRGAGPTREVTMHRFRFRAVITLDPQEPRPAALHPLASQYRNHTHALMIKASPLRYAGSARCFRPRPAGTAPGRCAREIAPG